MSTDSAEDLVLSAEDIPGACLSGPYEQHTIAALRWWLLCRGFKAPTSWKKTRDCCQVSGDFEQLKAIVVIYIHLQSEAE